MGIEMVKDMPGAKVGGWDGWMTGEVEIVCSGGDEAEFLKYCRGKYDEVLREGVRKDSFGRLVWSGRVRNRGGL